MKNLVAGRTHLRKKIRTNIDDGQLQAAKDEIASINGELKKLRREVKLCISCSDRMLARKPYRGCAFWVLLRLRHLVL